MKNLFFLIFVFSISFALALEIPSYQDKYVNDFAGVLSLQETNELRNLFSFIDQNTTAEIVFVSSSECLGDSDSYAMQIAEKWKPGKADKDNGLVILYCKTENRITVKTGYGLEGILPDAKVGRLLDQYYVPQRNLGNISIGIVDFSYAISDEILQNREEVFSEKIDINYPYIIFVILVFLVIGFLIYLLTKRKNKGISDFLVFFFVDFLFRMIIYSLLLRGNNNRSSGGGFSGGGFGGGGFGGGGASR